MIKAAQGQTQARTDYSVNQSNVIGSKSACLRNQQYMEERQNAN
jgi:hypothetical protein